MKNWTVPLPLAPAVLIMGVAVSIATKPADVLARGRGAKNPAGSFEGTG